VQVAAALRAVHSAGLYFRPGGLHPSKVILPTRGRLRLSSTGILDVLNGDPGGNPRIFQVRIHNLVLLPIAGYFQQWHLVLVDLDLL
jgi:hypothetical protein